MPSVFSEILGQVVEKVSYVKEYYKQLLHPDYRLYRGGDFQYLIRSSLFTHTFVVKFSWRPDQYFSRECVNK